jgi:hypothetical protein
MNYLQKVAVFFEAATGLTLLIAPSMVVQLLLGSGLSGVGVPVARVAGMALIGLAVACVPGFTWVGMTIYNALVMFYLAYLGLAGGFGGVLLWPAVAAHAGLTLLLVGYLFKNQSR